MSDPHPRDPDSDEVPGWGTDPQAGTAALETAPDGFVWLDGDGLVAFVNSAAEVLLRRHRGALLGRPLAAAVGGLPEGVGDLARDTFATGVPGEAELWAGPPFQAWWRVSAHPLHAGVGIHLRDVTTARRVAERLATVQHMESVGTLAGGIAHDFNNLLTVIAGHAELLADELADDPDLLIDVEAIRAAATRAAGLTRRLLAFSRRQVQRPVTLDLATTVLDLEPLLRGAVPAHCELVIETHPAPSVIADASAVAQALINIVVNAGEAVDDGGLVRITTGRTVVDEGDTGGPAAGTYSTVTVTDDGDGMDPDVAARAVEPFFSTRRERGATGLGLSAAFSSIAQIDGHLLIDSERGRGTTVSLLVPAAEDPA